MCLAYFGQRDLLHALWQEDPASPDALAAMLTHILVLVFDGIRRPPPPLAPPVKE